jgi:hypothetical protein
VCVCETARQKGGSTSVAPERMSVRGSKPESVVLEPSKDRPRAKAVVELQGCRSRRSWGASTKKRVDLGSLCHIEHETAPPFVDAPQLRAVPKIKYDASGRKPAQTRQKKKSGIFWGSSRPKHNHEARTDTAKHQCALIPTRRKMAIFPQGGQSTAPLARTRSFDCFDLWN